MNASTSASSPDTTADSDDVVRVKLLSVDDQHVEVGLPGTDYRLRLACDGAESLRPLVGRRIRGRIEGRALRMHVASAGGRFIEPSQGMPRIVQGSLRRADESSGRVLVDMAAPVWVAPMPNQCFDGIVLGGLVNFYMESGTRFVPVD